MPSVKTPVPAKPIKAPRTPAARKTAVTPKASTRVPAKAAPKKLKAARPQATRPPAAPVPTPAPAAKPPKQKLKLVRDSFAMPSADFELIHLLKERALSFRRPAKKSELLRAGLHALAALSAKQLHAALDSLAPLKPGRPKNVA